MSERPYHTIMDEGIDYGAEPYCDQPQGWVVTCQCGDSFYNSEREGARSAHAEHQASVCLENRA